MNKKVAFLLAALTIMSTLSGCSGGNTTQLPDKPVHQLPGTPPKPNSNVLPLPSDKETLPQPPETTTTEATTLAPEEPDPTQITNNPYYFSYNSDYMVFTENDKHYIYNLATEKMTKLPAGKGSLIYAEGDLAVISDSINVQMYNITKGELISESSEYAVTYANYLNDAVLVTKTDGDKMSFGVINNKCEWVHELTSDLAINKQEELTLDVLKDATYWLNGESIIMLTRNGKFLYSFTSDTVVPFENYLVAMLPDARIITSDDNKIFCTDSNTGETSVVYECGKLPTIFTDNQFFFFKDKDGTGHKYVAIDKTTLKEIEFDLSAHSVYNIHGAYGDKVVFTSKKSDEEYHAVIADKNGNILADPIPGEFAIEGGVYDKAKYMVYFSGDYVIINSADISGEYPDYIVDCANGKVIKCDYNIRVVNKSGKMLVEVKDGQNNGFFLIDINKDINTLINPLDKNN